jgi:hypothetical protein
MENYMAGPKAKASVYWDAKGEIVDTILSYLKTTDKYFPGKCKRDLEHIYDAVVRDTLEKRVYYVPMIANKFWYENRRQLEDFEVEFDAYDIMEAELKRIPLADIHHICQGIDILKTIVNYGPLFEDTLSMNTAANIAKHCQRSWDYTKEIPLRHVVSLADIATTMPAKQGRKYFEVFVSTDLEFNKKIKNVAIDVDNPDFPVWQNNQVTAPVLFFWAITPDTQAELNTIEAIAAGNEELEDGSMATGISAGAVALAAANYGYKTGFCRCFHAGVSDMLQERTGMYNKRVIVMLGIGHPDRTIQWNQSYDDNGDLQTVPSIIRNCKFHIIQEQ